MANGDNNELPEGLRGPNAPDLTGQSPTVIERFSDCDEIAEGNDDYIVFLDGMEKALVGTAEVNGVHVAVYERELCIRCIMEGFGDDWADTLGDYTDEQKADAEFMESEKYTIAVEHFEYNTPRSLPYQHEHAPLIIDGFFVDSERWEAFMGA